MTKFLDACYDAIRKQESSISNTIKAVKKPDVDTLLEKKIIVLLGCGDSYAAAQYGRWAFLKAGLNVITVSAPEISRIPINEKHLVVGITASGRSLATVEALSTARQKGALTVVLTDDIDGKAVQRADRVWRTLSGVDSYNISPSSPTTTAMAYLLKLATMTGRMTQSSVLGDVSRFENVGKIMVDSAEQEGIKISEFVNLQKPLYLVSDGPNYVAAQLGLMKFNEYSLGRTMAVLREEYVHHWNLALNQGDYVVLITDRSNTPEDEKYMNVLTETLVMEVFHLHTPSSLGLESSLAQTIANSVTLQMAAYHTVLKHEPEKEKWKQPNASAFDIY